MDDLRIGMHLLRSIVLVTLSMSFTWGHDPSLQVTEITRNAMEVNLLVSPISDESWSYQVQRSASLESDSWANEVKVTVQKEANLVRLTFPFDEADDAAGYFRVQATPVSITAAAAVRITEVMTNNETSLADGAGDFPDWIELHNHGDSAADLSGHTLSDNDSNPDKWTFPVGTTLAADAYLVVFASGKENDSIPEGEWHTNFKLSNGSEPVLFSAPDGRLIDRLSSGPMASDSSLGIGLGDPNTLYVYESSRTSPGKANTRFIFGAPQPFIQAPSFVTKGGIHDGPVMVELIAPRPGDTIRYSTDGAEPFHTLFKSNSTLYEGPFEVSQPTVIRTLVVVGGGGSRVVTQTYLVGVNHSLPVISMAANPTNFDYADGYLYGFGNSMFNAAGNVTASFPYSGSNAWKRDREVEASFEVYEPEDGDNLNMQVGVKIFGGWGSRGYPQKSMAIFARSEYGYGKIRHPFFPDKDISSFESIVLRNSGNDNQSTWLTVPRTEIKAFSTPAGNGSYFVNGNFTMFRDALMQSLIRETGLDTQSYRPAVLYLNGDYWGIYNIREKFTEHYVESTHDVPADEVDLIEGYGSANSGSASTYNQMRSFIGSRSMNDPEDYQTVKDRYLDIDNFIDYHLSVIYGQNFDIGNIKCWRPQREEGGQFRWMLYDQDYSFNLWKPDVYLPAMKRNFSDYENMFTFHTNISGSGTGWPNQGGRTLLFREMLESDVFRARLIQRCADLLNSNFSTETVLAQIDKMAAIVRPEIDRHLTRWGWAALQERGFGSPHKEEDKPLNLEHWERNVEVMREFARVRPDALRDHLMDHFDFKNGLSDIQVTVSGPSKGTVQLNTLVIDQPSWSGVYFRDVPPQLTAVPSEGARFVRWSGAVESVETTIALPLDSAMVSVVAEFE